LEYILFYGAIRFNLWRLKHENTQWHLAHNEEDDFDIPGWEDVKGASHEAYLMNQRITSETFRYKFLNYNKAWLISQLPLLLTPRTLRKSRPHLINQFARIISSRRDDISDDSDGEGQKKFGPVALTASSRDIIRWWLGKARRRLKLRSIVDPLIRMARGDECELCLSRKQLQVEYEIDLDTMVQMYDQTYPGDAEVDQLQWKSFWTSHQKYHTICLACLTRRKEVAARDAMIASGLAPGKGPRTPGLYESGLADDIEKYPDWGAVYLTAASKAILLNWYRKAKKLREGKRANRKKREKVVKQVSDDEGDDIPSQWTQNVLQFTPATKAMAIKWMRTARARLQHKAGKGAGIRESGNDYDDVVDNFRSGTKSRSMRK
jgi:hypothetical protein